MLKKYAEQEICVKAGGKQNFLDRFWHSLFFYPEDVNYMSL
jgi:hypothetical protein